MIKETKIQEIKEGNQILDIIPHLIKLPQVSTQTGEQNSGLERTDFKCFYFGRVWWS